MLSSVFPKSGCLHHKAGKLGLCRVHSQNVAVAALLVKLESPQRGLGCCRASCCPTAEQSWSLPQGVWDQEKNGAA